jgi:hypothetical protein
MKIFGSCSFINQKALYSLFPYFFFLILFLSSGFILVNAKPFSDIRLLTSNQSYPLFSDCGKTVPGDRGARSLDDLTPEQSANLVLLDNNTSTKIAGKALFELSWGDRGIANWPGDDLIVYETTNAEAFMMSVFDSAKNRFTPMREYLPTPFGSEKTACGSNINAAGIDLSSFGISNGTSTSLLFFDNLGESNGFAGADISDIVPVQRH